MGDDQTEALRELHETLKEQNLLLKGILEFMCPMSEFAKSARIILRFGAWLAGITTALLSAWQVFENFIKHK